MLLIGSGKIMCAREVLLGAHVQIVVGCAIQYSVDTCHRCNLDGAGRQTGILIGVRVEFYSKRYNY